MERIRQKAAARRTLTADPVIDGDPVGWITSNFFIPETVDDPDPAKRGRLTLYPAQEIPLREALAPGDGVRFQYSTIVWSAIKKSAKSTIAGSVGLWFGFRKPYSQIKVVANDLRQADSRVFYYIRRCLELNDKLDGPLAGRSKVKNYHIELDNGSIIEAIPIDPKGEAGGNDDCVIYSEIWGWKNKAAQQMWTESTLSPMKYGESVRWCETYAGSEGESPVLENLYRSGVTDGEPLNPEYETFVNKEARQFTLWMTKPSLPWQTDDYYAQEQATLDDSEFDRVHRNQWGTFTGRVYPGFSKSENVTVEADYHPDKGEVYWGGDDGFAKGKGPGTESYHPRAFLVAQLNHLGGLDVFAEYEKPLVSDYKVSIQEVLDYGYPEPDAAYIDSSAQMLIATLWDDYGIYAYGSTHPVHEGVKNLRRLIGSADGTRLIRIHPRCKRLIESLSKLRFAETGTAKAGEMKILKIDDHLPDCLRYLAFPLRIEQ